MTEQSMPNPVELYGEAVKNTRQIIANVRPDQTGASTPCSEWDVKALIDHMIGGTMFFAATLAGEEPGQPNGDGNPADIYRSGAEKVLEGAQKPGAMEKKYETPFGEMSGGEFMFGAFMDNVVHGWDLAKATGQNTDINEAHAQICYGAFAPMMDGFRQAGAFGPEVSVPDNAGIQHKLLGMMGRQP